jgi:NADPH-dependent 2,4-dienoyl-CoA reductase/sulfur reductase-like enzyme
MDPIRRNILATGAAATAVAAAPGVFAQQKMAAYDGEWDEIFDVVVVGSGAAGLATALAACDLGLRPVVLENG